MSLYPMNPLIGEKIQTNVAEQTDGWSQIATFTVTPLTAANNSVQAGIGLTGSTQIITTNITNPDVPRNVTITGSAGGMAGNVVVNGTDITGTAISDTIALSGSSTVQGILAFNTVGNIHVPVQVHTPHYQVETATVVAASGITQAGNATVIITSALLTDSPKTISVAVALSDAASDVAQKIRTALGLISEITANYTVGGAGANVSLTSLNYAANDATLNIETENGTCTGLTTEATSVHTQAGAAQDIVQIGCGSKLGLNHCFTRNTILNAYLNNALEGTAPTVTIDPVNISANTIKLNSSLNGDAVVANFIIPG